MANPELANAIRASAARLGINPHDLGTVISYETAGTFDPWQRGPTTQWGQHRGLIQWGEPQRQKYGVYEGMPVGDQLQAVERYLTDAGVQPGMGILDVYSAINAGKVGRYNASDANNGGAPGTVADKVNSQMAGHRTNAERLLGAAEGQPVTAAAPVAGTPTQAATLPAGLLGMPPEQTDTAKAASDEAFQKQIAGLLAHATGQNDPQTQGPAGLMEDQFQAPARFPQIQIQKFSRRRA